MPPSLQLDKLADQSIPELIGQLSTMHSGQAGSLQGAIEAAHRQAIQCLIEEKLTATHIKALNELNESINNLNSSTTKLTKVGWVLTALITLASVLVPLYLKK